MSIELVMPSNHLILCHPLLLPPSIFPSIRVFSNVSVLPFRWPKYWSFSFSISPSNEHPGLISFRMDWLDLLAVQGTLKSLLRHHSSKHQFFLALTPTLTRGLLLPSLSPLPLCHLDSSAPKRSCPHPDLNRRVWGRPLTAIVHPSPFPAKE